MANFPFKDATFTSYADLSYPILNYGSVYYTKINGRITAVKPIALGIYKKESDPTSGLTKQLNVLAADGKRYNLNMNARRLFLTAADAVAYERSTSPTYYSPIKEKRLDDIFRANGACRDWHTLKVYVWNEKYGEAYYTEGGYMFWADSDGEHIGYAGGIKAMPDNLHIIFSDWRGAEFDNPYEMPVSSPLWPDGTKGPHCTDKTFLCPGSCEECAENGVGCWVAGKGDTILFIAH